MNISYFSEICVIDVSLRPYQQKAKKEIFESWDKVDSVMFQMPTGTGKTRLFTCYPCIVIATLSLVRITGTVLLIHVNNRTRNRDVIMTKRI